MTTDETPLEQLLLAAQAGDRTAYDSFLRTVIPIIRRFIIATSRGSISHEDALQEVLLTTHRALHTYQYPSPALPWLKAITRNKVIDIFRSSRKDAHLETEEALERSLGCTQAGGRLPPEDLADLKVFWALLTTEEQKLLQLVKIDGYPFHEIAEEFQVSEGTLKVRVHRILRKLQEQALRDIKMGLVNVILFAFSALAHPLISNHLTFRHV